MIRFLDLAIAGLILVTGTLLSWGVSFFTGIIKILISSTRDEKKVFFVIVFIFGFDIYILMPMFLHNTIFWLFQPFIILMPIVDLMRLGRRGEI